MASCPLCSGRAGKRYCPAKGVQICAVCCGTEREVEIDCPSSCTHLKASRSYEAEKQVPDPQLAAQLYKYDEKFLGEFSPILDAISRSVIEERLQSPWLVDRDVIEVYKALHATMKTLASGIYYESLPGGPLRISLFRRLKAVLDELMKPGAVSDRGVRSDRGVLKVSEALDVLNFLTFTAQMNSSVRPKARRYLDWLANLSGIPATEHSSGLILP